MKIKLSQKFSLVPAGLFVLAVAVLVLAGGKMWMGYFGHAASGPSTSHVPEPSSLALFGSGFLTMLITFLRRAYHLAKRTIDIIGSIAGLVLLLPVCLLAALLVKLTSKGPVFYTQERLGKSGKPFKIYKFRTMRADAEKNGAVWASQNDERVTPVGRILRKSRIDEVPQFLNVLEGDMSLVGPRPERRVFADKLKIHISDYEKRLAVKPGITGLAQVHHRYDVDINDVRKKVKYDILYIKNVSFATDLQILLRTFRVVLTGAGAC